MRPLALCLGALASLAAAQSYRDFGKAPNTYAPFSPQWPDPVPNATGYGWTLGFQRAKALVSQLTLEEKAYVCTGKGFAVVGSRYASCQGNIQPITRLNFNGICYADSHNGLGNTHMYANGYPAALHAASTWNR
ncbi:hypothetical protein OF83DRAFT_258695, partial [Amylostereum chailletii]